eukprot:1160605-Prymnesium_polylepis.1
MPGAPRHTPTSGASLLLAALKLSSAERAAANGWRASASPNDEDRVTPRCSISPSASGCSTLATPPEGSWTIVRFDCRSRKTWARARG